MPGATGCRGFPFPTDGEAIDVAGDIMKLAGAVDDDLCAAVARIDELVETVAALANDVHQLRTELAAVTGGG